MLRLCFQRRKMTVYFDNAATTRVCPEAIREMDKLMSAEYGNPSSTHLPGRQAKARLDTARERVAKALGADSGEIFFTSGGTEADNWAVLGTAEKYRHAGKHIITTAAEHDAVRAPSEKLRSAGYEVTYLKPDSISGSISVEDVEKALRDDTILVSVMLVNNETGAVNPVGGISSLLKARKSCALLHTDAVQAFCKMDFSPKSLGADLVSISSHKIHGPKGAGALFIKSGLRLPPVIMGGAQEKGFRGGTEALPAICGFGAAAETARCAAGESYERAAKLKALAVRQLESRIPGLRLLCDTDFPYILSISLPGYKSEVLMNYLDAEGICVSKSSACKKGARSHVLEAMGLDSSVIDGAIRVSFSRYNTPEECVFFAEKLEEASKKLFKVLGK